MDDEASEIKVSSLSKLKEIVCVNIFRKFLVVWIG